ncbi:glucans biosynthesis glucosyltransferase MdoH [Acetobacteraceae bacterium H6797]|nr:glucans biosynthesis glucosyltransferase MdoH [Acetobacteraceae bacterium H6797]
MDGVTKDTAMALPGGAALPPEAPLAMPTQSLRERPSWRGRLPSSPANIGLRRAVVILPAIALTFYGAYEMGRVLDIERPTVLAVIMMVLFLPLFAWIALSFTSSLAGFFSLLVGGERRLGIDPRQPMPIPQSRTALLLPCYNEDPVRSMAGLEAVHLSLVEAGIRDRFDLYVLSDTTDPDVWIAEERQFLEMRRRYPEAGGLYYRRRPKNTARKAGNIADWVERWGGLYEQFLILDADSVMAADTLARMVDAMERHPDVGLIQTLPVIVNGHSLLARMQQFAGRVYGPLIAHGIAWWHGAEGNYWGHNAMIRTRAFAEQAGLPELRGRKPFGGHILSHDFVEAALMRRGGWAMHMVPTLTGSYEESPPSLIDLALRDRRWCQGNLQHMAVLPAKGLHWVSRTHLLTGIGSYITAPMWLLFLLAGMLISLQVRLFPPTYFPEGPALFPRWPSIDPVRAMWVFGGTMGLLLAPKLLAWFAAMLRGPERRGCGGVIRSFISVLMETIIAGLIAPVSMLTQSGHVFSILLGRDGGWQAQRRDDGSIPFRQVLHLYWFHTTFGIAMAVASWFVSPALAAWTAPVAIGLALSILLVMLTGARGPGVGLRRLGFLRIPEETAPPQILQTSRSVLEARRAEAPAEPPCAVRALREDPALASAHLAMLPPPRRPRVDPIDGRLLAARLRAEEAETLAEALDGMPKADKAVLLTDERGVNRLLSLPR